MPQDSFDLANTSADIDDIDKIRLFNGRLQQCRRHRSRLVWMDLSVTELTSRLLESRRAMQMILDREDRLLRAFGEVSERLRQIEAILSGRGT